MCKWTHLQTAHHYWSLQYVLMGPLSTSLGCRRLVTGQQLLQRLITAQPLLLKSLAWPSHLHYAVCFATYVAIMLRMDRVQSKKCSETEPKRRHIGGFQYEELCWHYHYMSYNVNFLSFLCGYNLIAFCLAVVTNVDRCPLCFPTLFSSLQMYLRDLLCSLANSYSDLIGSVLFQQ